MNLLRVVLSALLVVAALSAVVSCAAFTSGNILAIKAERQYKDKCVKAYISELTPSGETVQEIALPTEVSDGTHPCLVRANEYYENRLTVSTDGYRAIMPCCTYINETDTYLTSFAVIYGNGVIQTTAPFDANNGTVSALYNAVLDGEDVWFSTYGALFYTTLTSNTSTLVSRDDVFTLRIYEGNLYASNYENMESAIGKIGEGLPKTLSNTTAFLNKTDSISSVNAVEFTEKYLTIGVYPNGLYIFNKTSLETVYSNIYPGEIVQLIVLEEEGKILAHLNEVEIYPVIYEFTFNDQIGLPNGTLWLSGYNTSEYYYYGISKAPQDSCQDNVKNFDETDVDCGGSLCSSRCVDGKGCSVASDCSSNVCTNGVCGLPTPSSTPTSTPTSSQKSPTAATSSANALFTMIPSVVVLLLGLIMIM